MIRVVVADDHALIRRGVRQTLAETPDMVVADECASGKELLEKVVKDSCSLVLLDISMPDGDGIELLRTLRAINPRLPVLIMSMHPEEHYALHALRAGAAGYIGKDRPPEELLTAIRKVYWGGRYVSDSLANRIACDLAANQGKPPHSALSDREFQIFCMISNGKSITGIAETLDLSVKTVSTYRKRILYKMNMANNAEIIKYAMNSGLA